jgi:hypothetical protein
MSMVHDMLGLDFRQRAHFPESDVAWFVFFTVLALAFRLFELGSASLWVDEGVTFVKCHFDWKTLAFSTTDNKPPLFYLLTKPFLILGDSEFVLRLSSAVFVSLAVGASVFLGQEIGGRRGRIILPLLLLIHDVSLVLAQDARHYSLLTLSIVLGAIGLVRMMRALEETSSVRDYLRAHRWNGALMVFAGVLALYSHPVALYYLFTMSLGAVIYSVIRGTWRAFVPALGLVVLVIFILWIPWFVVFVSLLVEGGTLQHREWVSGGDLVSYYLDLFGGRFVWYFGRLPAVGMIFLALAGIILLIRKGKAGNAWILGLGLTLTPFLMWLTGIVKPIVNFRAVAPAHVYAMAAVAAFLANVRFSGVRWIVGVGVFLLFARSAYVYYTWYEKEQWKEAGQYLSLVSGENDLVVMCQPWSYGALMYYLREPKATVAAVGEDALLRFDWSLAVKNTALARRGLPNIEYPEIGRRMVEATHEIYVVNRTKACDHRPIEDVLGNLGVDVSHPDETVRFYDISVRRFSLRHPEPSARSRPTAKAGPPETAATRFSAEAQ